MVKHIQGANTGLQEHFSVFWYFWYFLPSETLSLIDENVSKNTS